MFSKKTCQRCGRKTSKTNSFCPSCGTPLKKMKNKEEFGMIGENDAMGEFEPLSNSMFGGIGSGFMNKMISNTMKMLEKEMEREMRSVNTPNQMRENKNFPRTKIRLMINGKEINLNNGMYAPEDKEKKEKQRQNQIRFKKFTEEQIKRFSKLPKKEPKTELKRIADKITYEIEMPGVESLEDITITPLEGSIELKAISQDKAYTKSIPITLPITGYNLSEGVFVLEFKGN